MWPGEEYLFFRTSRPKAIREYMPEKEQIRVSATTVTFASNF